MKPVKTPDIVRIDIDPTKLVTHDWNPNQMSDKEFALLKENISSVGFIDPVTVVQQDDGTYALLGGEHRAKAAIELKLETIPADVVQSDKLKQEDERKFQNVRLNVIHGQMNPEKMLSLYNEMAKKYGNDKVARLMGYTSDAGIKKIIKNVADEMKSSLPPEMVKEFEEKAKAARTMADLDKIIKHIFETHGDSVKYNFLIFAWGGTEHIYVAMNKKVHQAMKKVMAKSKSGEIDINELIGDAIEYAASTMDGKG